MALVVDHETGPAMRSERTVRALEGTTFVPTLAVLSLAAGGWPGFLDRIESLARARAS